MRASLVGDESYDEPPRLCSGVLVAIKGVVHVCAQSHGIFVRMYCTDHEEPWKPYHVLEQGWFEAPTCVRCAINPQALTSRMLELRWRLEWLHGCAGDRLVTPCEIEPTL